MSTFTFSLEGVMETVANIDSMDRQAKNRVVQKATVRAAAVMRKVMRRYVKMIPELNSASRKEYSRAIANKRLKARQGLSAVMVGPEDKRQSSGNNWGKLANIFEGGAGPHSISAGSGARILSDGSQVFGRSVSHPGIKGHESLRKGFEASTPEAMREALRVMHLEIEKAVKAR